jgi:hypothetical protein
METKFDWLNTQIDHMQADERLTPNVSEAGYRPGREDIELLVMAAELKSLRPGAGEPRPEFLSDLRVRMLAAV